MLDKELSNYIQHLPGVKEHFIGVYTLEKPPKNVPRNGFAVLHRTLGAVFGGHWLILFKRDNTHFEVFDSLKLPEEQRDKLARHFKLSIYSNSSILQPSGSDKCGFYCIYFLHKRFLNVDLPLPDFLDIFFSNDLQKNEETINNYKNELHEKNESGTEK